MCSRKIMTLQRDLEAYRHLGFESRKTSRAGRFAQDQHLFEVSFPDNGE